MKEIKLSSGIYVRVREVPNISVWQHLAKAPLVLPLPPIFTLDDGREVEHTQSEIYQNALVIFDIMRSEYAFQSILELAVEFDERLMLGREWKGMWQYLKEDTVMDIKQDERTAFLQFYAIQDGKEKFDITRNAILNELEVYVIFKAVQVSRDGYDIHRVQMQNSISTGIEVENLSIEGVPLVNPLDEMAACKDFGLSWLDWFGCKYTNEFKANVVGLHRLQKIVSAHQDDAVQIQSEKKSKAK